MRNLILTAGSVLALLAMQIAIMQSTATPCARPVGIQMSRTHGIFVASRTRHILA